ncbi:MAG: glycosyltransferase family 2 protein [Bacteroidota bacterium]
MDKTPFDHSISIVIVNYNVRFFLEQALQSVLKATADLSIQVWVVDNASSDDSIDMVKQKFPTVKIIENKENVGFARANNMALRQSNADYVLLLNPDTLLEESSLHKCFHFMENNPQAGALGVRMIDGTGNFLPESKRGIPTPWVAFCKTFGLSALFPFSKQFNAYHLGFLSEFEIAEAPVLSGAFMFIRMEALQKAGFLDEDFFMYGEDIDLSVRILQAGFKNYYFPETTIIHYKGESTRKGTVNYVRIFYQAMILFAEKHFAGKNRKIYVFLLYIAIYLRAFGTLIGGFFKKTGLPILDGLLTYMGLVMLQFYWGWYRFSDENYYDERFFYVNAPLYVIIWITMLFFSGAYDKKLSPKSILSSLLIGSLIIAAIYGFFEPAYRNSRALIVLGTLWSALSILGSRFLLFSHFRKDFFKQGKKRFLTVGSLNEGLRTQKLLDSIGFNAYSLGIVSPSALDAISPQFLGNINDLDDICRINQIDDIIFCSKDVTASQIMYWMSKMGGKYQFRIMQESNASIISSYSKNDPGELFTYRIHLNLADVRFLRQKRLFDLIFCFVFLVLFPFLVLFQRKNSPGIIGQLITVLKGERTWIGYGKITSKDENNSLPTIPEGVLTLSEISHAVNKRIPSEEKVLVENIIYARHYTFNADENKLFQYVFSRFI